MASRNGTSERATSPESPETGPEPSRSVLSNLGRVVAGLAIAASFGVWAYAYSGQADRPPPDLLLDSQIAVRAEALCAAALADVEAMPSASEAVDAADRSQQVQRSTDRFEAMVDELENIRVEQADDRVIMGGWIGDWRVLIEDRRTYARAVATEPNSVLLLTKVADAERLDRRLTRVANTNRMPSCGAPTDVG